MGHEVHLPYGRNWLGWLFFFFHKLSVTICSILQKLSQSVGRFSSWSKLQNDPVLLFLGVLCFFFEIYSHQVLNCSTNVASVHRVNLHTFLSYFPFYEKRKTLLAYRVVCCSHQSDRRVRVCISHQSHRRIGVCISHQSDCRIRVCISQQSYCSIRISCITWTFGNFSRAWIVFNLSNSILPHWTSLYHVSFTSKQPAFYHVF